MNRLFVFVAKRLSGERHAPLLQLTTIELCLQTILER